MGQAKQRGTFQHRRETALHSTAAKAEQFLFIAQRIKRQQRVKQMTKVFMGVVVVLTALCVGWLAHMGEGG